MVDIDRIMDLFDWNNSPEDQDKGLQLAKNVRSINVFIQPCEKAHSKNVWDNCAKALCDRADAELMPYLPRLLEWLADMNWPGAWQVFDRLSQYEDNAAFDSCCCASLRCATALKEINWKKNLLALQKQRKMQKTQSGEPPLPNK